MPVTYENARDEMLSRFKVQWDADTPAVTTTIPQLFFDGVPRAEQPDARDSWAQVTIRHSQSTQASLAGENGVRRYERLGIIIVSVFAPLILAGGLGIGEKLSQIARKAFEGKTTAGGIWFRNVNVAEIGLSEAWYQWNITTEFVYDEIV